MAFGSGQGAQEKRDDDAQLAEAAAPRPLEVEPPRAGVWQGTFEAPATLAGAASGWYRREKARRASGSGRHPLQRFGSEAGASLTSHTQPAWNRRTS